jgi:hypothetical protein
MVVAPTGGKKDSFAPELLYASTPSGEVNFNKKKVVFQFNEFIQLNNVLQQIVVSPAMEILPDFEVSGKSIVMKLRDTLRTNTTYTINFGNAVVDVHEQNPLNSFTYTFSTGNFIDSFKVSGRCFNSYTLTPGDEMLVGLYSSVSFQDSFLYYNKPNYFTKSNTDGSFVIRNLPAGAFNLFAFKDANRNLKYDANEVIGFYPEIIQTTDTINESLQISTFFQNMFKSNTLIDTISRFAGVYNFVFYNPIRVNILNDINKDAYVLTKIGEKSFDTLVVFISDTSKSPVFSVNTVDTSYNLSLKKSKNTRFQPFVCDIPRMVELNDTLRISFTNPLSNQLDTSLIVLKEDTTQVKYSYIYKPENGLIYVYYPWKESTKYSILLKDSSLYDIYKQTQKKLQSTWTSRNIKDYATLELNITGVEDNQQYLLEIWSEDEKKILYQFTISKNNIIRIGEILPGSVKIKVILDKNKNGKWDNGDVFKKISPERIGYMKEKIVLRAYWDLELLIDLQKVLK